ncbi:MAG TPA: GNAT family N-acetyltransferase [Gemmatimonadaceae bacterium]|nr:GNAT family N-acetyltransferase [Gemmatimonadaceae bacterium]
MLGRDDANVLERVAADVFDNDIEPGLVAEFLADPRHHLAVAIEDGVVVGMASAVHYVHPDKLAEMFVNEVGVTPAYQRRGIGRQLMQALLGHAKQLGCAVAWVGTETTNAAARGLYAAVGGKEAPMIVVSFDL